MNEAGVEVINKLHAQIVQEKLPKEAWRLSIETWMHRYNGYPEPEQPNPWDNTKLSFDSIGYIYWRGRQVEHYSRPSEMTEQAWKLAARCQYLETMGVIPSGNASWTFKLVEDVDQDWLHFMANVRSSLWQSGDRIAFQIGMYKVNNLALEGRGFQ